MLRSLFMFGFMMRTTINNHLKQALSRHRPAKAEPNPLNMKAAVALLMAHRALYTAKQDAAYWSAMTRR